MTANLLCEKYRASCFADIKGQDIAIARIEKFMKNFPEKTSLILSGPPGTGKTALAYALAIDTNSEILELNASDLRNRESVEKILGSASQQKSLTKKGKIILVDEVDGITKEDYGGLPELIRLISETKFPIIITSNNIWDRKFSELRRKSELIELRELNYKLVYNLLKDVAEKEDMKIPQDLLINISIKSRGDIRAALNDLQVVNEETKNDEIAERDKEEKIFDVLRKIFKNQTSYETLQLYDKLNMPLDEVFLWLEENIPLEYKNEELASAFDALSKADVFRGRIHRQQHWRFLVYQNLLLSAGVSASKTQIKTGFTMYKKPSRILKIWMINQKTAYKKSIAEKYAEYCHISIKRAKHEFPIIKQIIASNPDIAKELKLEKDEIEYLQD